MAFNTGSNNNQQKGRTTYTPIKYTNIESKVDQTRLSFEYWNSTLKIKITHKKETGNNEIAFDDNDSAIIFITSDKAKIFANELRNFMKDSITYNNCGVNTMKGVITVNNGAQYGTANPIIIIRQIDQVDGTILKTYAYECKSEYYFAIRNLDASDTEINGFDKEFESYKNLELEQIVSILENFCNASSYAYAAIQNKADDFRETAMNNKIESIMAKLGIEYNPKSQRNTYGQNGSFFFGNNNNNQPRTQNDAYENKYTQLSSLDDIDDGLN